MVSKQTKPSSSTDNSLLDQSIATFIYLGTAATKLGVEAAKSAVESINDTTKAVSDRVVPTAHQFVEQGAETIGKLVTPIVDNPLVKYATKVPGINLLMAALGQVDVDKAQSDVENLRQTYPTETPEQLAHRMIVDTALKAGGVGLATNMIPPLALTLFAIDLAAVNTLQAEMVYRIAAIYGFSLKDPARRGEVLAIFGLSMGGSGALKAGLGIVELIPAVGAVVGASSNAALLYSLGYAASRFYETKRRVLYPSTSQSTAVVPSDPTLDQR